MHFKLNKKNSDEIKTRQRISSGKSFLKKNMLFHAGGYDSAKF